MKTAYRRKLIMAAFPALLLSGLCMPKVVADEHGARQLERHPAQQPEVPAANDAEQYGNVKNQGRYSSNSLLRDAWLHGKLEVALALNPELNPFTITTDLNNGVARLSGSVDSYIARDLADQVARIIDGIMGVENQLSVTSGDKTSQGEAAVNSLHQNIDDVTITANIKTKLANSDTEGLSINVTTTNKVVTLAGAVSTVEEKNLAGLIAKNTSVVKWVDNRIEVANWPDTDLR